MAEAEAEQLIDAFADMLAEALGLEVGTDIFVGLNDSGGEKPVTSIIATGGPGGGHTPLVNATFQIFTRGVKGDDKGCMDRAWAIYNALLDDDGMPVRNVDLSVNWRALAITAIQPPTDLGLSEGLCRQYSFNVLIKAAAL